MHRTFQRHQRKHEHAPFLLGIENAKALSAQTSSAVRGFSMGRAVRVHRYGGSVQIPCSLIPLIMSNSIRKHSLETDRGRTLDDSATLICAYYGWCCHNFNSQASTVLRVPNNDLACKILWPQFSGQIREELEKMVCPVIWPGNFDHRRYERLDVVNTVDNRRKSDMSNSLGDIATPYSQIYRFTEFILRNHMAKRIIDSMMKDRYNESINISNITTANVHCIHVVPS